MYSIFLFSMDFNGSYAFRNYPSLTKWQQTHQELVPDMSGTTRPGVRRCGTCGEILDKWHLPLSGLAIKDRKYDISLTFDGIIVVSRRFKSSYESSDLIGLNFEQLPDDPEFFSAFPLRAVLFDVERRKTRFIKQCAVCGHYESVVGATPVFLKPGGCLTDREFVRSDIEFGSGDGKHHLLLCGSFVVNTLRSAKLIGLDFVKFDVDE